MGLVETQRDSSWLAPLATTSPFCSQWLMALETQVFGVFVMPEQGPGL